MATSSRAVTVGTEATRLDFDEAYAHSSASFYNAGAATVYIGPAGVTTSTGYPLAAGEHLSADLDRVDVVYGIVASGTVEVRVFEVGV